ncbi:uncharacterized protein [Salminus brasiliensis]|uniref:uncharacterized protein n=1 Tax=Salminus brasiliensis TaxID=930266 RepID=UPI003B82E553
MLQQNNNNNYLCLDMAHRELLQGCSRTSAPLSFGAIGFGAIPLIKGLRAWAVSGGFSARSRRKAVGENHNHQLPDRPRGWKTKENLASFRTPGALVTVATLKGSEGVRQTQTRCLFLKAEGCSYLCTVGSNRVPGPRAAGQRMHPKSAEGMSRGRRASQDDAGVCEVKPQVIRKWRKSSKMGKSTEKSSASERKDIVSPLKLDQGPGSKWDSFTSQTDAQREAPSATSDCANTQCLKAKHKHAASTTQSGTVNKNTAVNDVNESHLHQTCEPDTSAEASSSGSRPHKDSLDRATAGIKHKSYPVADINLNHIAKSEGEPLGSAVPKSKEFSPESEELMQVNIGRNGAAEVEENSSQSYEETSIVNPSRTPSDGTLLINTEEEQSKITVDEDLRKSGNEVPAILALSEEMDKEEGLVMADTKSPKEHTSHGHDLPDVVSESKVRVDNSSKKNENGRTISDMEENKDVASTKSLVENCSTVSMQRMDQDSVKDENDQPEVVLHKKIKEKEDALDMSSTNSPIKGPGERVESRSKASMDKDQKEVTIYSEDVQKDEDEALDLVIIKNAVEDCGQDLDPAKLESRAGSDKDLKIENGQSEVAVHSYQIEKYEEKVLDVVSTKSLVESHGQGHYPTGVCEIKVMDIANTRSPREDPGQGHVGPLEECCPPQQVNSGFEEQWFAKSPSQDPPKASVAVTIACLPNPAFTSTSNSTTAIATAPPALGRQEEVGAGFRSLGPQAESQLLSEQKRGQDRSKVATNERPVEVGAEEEDEFGVFMQAGQEEIWTEDFNRFQQVPSRTHDGVGYRNSTDANKPMSWTYDWTEVQSVHQSDDTWAAFKQEDDSRGPESEIASGGQWWSSTAAENTHLTLSSLHNVSSVFLEAFPFVDSSSGDTDCVPTLKELLQRPAENSRAAPPQNQSLLDGLQDLDRMIDVKYKRAESLSRKLLLQSLHLGAVISERVSSRKQATARFSPNLPTSNQQLAANAKRRLSYDINRNIMA